MLSKYILSDIKSILSHDMSLWRLRYTTIGKQVDTAIDAFFSLTTCEVLQHAALFFAAFIQYIIKHLFHEYPCSIAFGR